MLIAASRQPWHPPRVRSFRHAVLLALAATASGCAARSVEDAGKKGHPEAGPALDSSAPEQRWIRLTLPAIYDRNEGPGGIGEIVPIAGVEVCVEQARPWGGKWDDFRDVDRARVPCQTSAVGTAGGVLAGERLVFPEVPAMAELIVTAKKDGYTPSVFAVTTGKWDHDTTASNPSASKLLTVRRIDAPWGDLPVGAAPPPSKAILRVFAVTLEGIDPWPSTGAKVVIAGSEAHEVFYSAALRMIPGATSTPGVPFGVADLDHSTSAATFTDLSPGEYVVTVEQPGAFFKVAGFGYGEAFHGFSPVGTGTLRVPVLGGHVTQAAAICRCVTPGTADLHAGTCGAGPADGGGPH
jgi:hypothetical protein